MKIVDAIDSGEEAGAAILFDQVRAFLGRFVVYPSQHAHVAHTLWVAHTFVMDAWESTPRIAFLSPEPASGKTRALEVSVLLVPRPVEAINVTPAYLFRKVGSEEGPPTILYDEIDTVFGPKAKDNEEIRALLNAGHRRGAVAGRCVVHGKTVLTEEIPAYCAVALAGLGWLPETIMTRSIVVAMRRRAPGERIQPFRRRLWVREGDRLRNRLTAWGKSAVDHLRDNWPALPDGIADRDADVWEPIIALADLAGGAWPELAREAAVEMIKAGKEREPSLGIRLLADLRTVFKDREAMTTSEILVDLVAMEEAPWGDLKGKPLDARGLSRRLRQYGIKPGSVGPTRLKGYQRADLQDAWGRYLPPLGAKSAQSAQSAQSEQDQELRPSGYGSDERSQPAPDRSDERMDEPSERSRADEPLGKTPPVSSTRADRADRADMSGNGGAERSPDSQPGLSQRRVEELAAWYQDRAYGAYQEHGDVSSADLDAGLRMVLAEEVLPEFIETEFQRIMQSVFRV